MMIVALAVLAALAVGGIAYAIFYGRIRGSTVAEQRLGQLRDKTESTAPVIRTADAAAKRRKAVQDSLKEMEVKERAKARNRSSPPLDLRLTQAGLTWSKQTFFIFGAISGVVFLVLALFIGAPIYVAVGLGAAGAVGFPFWVVNFRRKRRFNVDRFCLLAGVEALAEMMEEDATTVCGARHRRHGDRRGYRWGRTHSEIGYHGGKVKVARPRVRDRAGKEVSLESWQALRDGNLLLEWALNLMVLNVSTRKYHRAVRLPEGDLALF